MNANELDAALAAVNEAIVKKFKARPVTELSFSKTVERAMADRIVQLNKDVAELNEELTFYRQRTASLQGTVERQAAEIERLRRKLVAR